MENNYRSGPITGAPEGLRHDSYATSQVKKKMASVRSETSDLINVRIFLSNWDNDVYLRCAGMIEDKNAVLAERMELSAENIDELESVCR